MVAVKTVRRAKASARRRRPWVRALKIVGALILLVAAGAAIVGGFRWKSELDAAAKVLPNLASVMDRVRKSPTVIVSDDGTTLYTMSSERRLPVRSEEIPRVVIDATLAAEDKRFFEHQGVDVWALGRVLVTNAREGRLAQGASTLTMQLAKRVYTGPERTFDRKIRDMALAVMMERKLTKQQILELYLNQVFYGSGAYGIGAAAQTYFGKDLNELSVAEAATLARCVRRPSDENPIADPERAVQNRNVVLGIMREEGMIDEGTYQAAIAEPLRVRRASSGAAASAKLAPYFVDAVLEQLRRETPDVDYSAGGYRIETTLVYRIQRIAGREVIRLVRSERSASTAAMLVMARDGRVLAMVGGVDYDRNQFNMIVQGRRQPGSAFKPFIYAAALENGTIDASSSLSNERIVMTDPSTGKTWRPENANGRYGGWVSVRSALAMSINLPAIRVLEKVGVSTAIQVCRRSFGFESDLDPVLPLALGASAVSPMELAQGYSVFQLGGSRAKPRMIKRVIGPDGEVVRAWEPEIVSGVLSAQTAQTMDQLLRAVVTSGTATAASAVANARGKTGTTSDHRDAWFVGYTDELVGVGWVADEERTQNGRWRYRSMPGVFGGRVTVRMWTAIMKEAQQIVGEKRREVEAAPASSGRRSEDDSAEPPATPPGRREPVRESPPADDEWVLPPLDPPPKPPARDAPAEQTPTTGP
jgi:penicillin-binding protein 1A